MTTYDYYKKHFACRTIPEEAFDGVVERARVVLDKIKSAYKVKNCAVTEGFALYRMAEEIYRDDQRQSVAQSRVGEVSVIYAQDVPLEKRLLRIASLYLKIYRGVGQ